MGLARAIRRQKSNTDLGGCNSSSLEKNIAFDFCLISAALNREKSFSRNCDRPVAINIHVLNKNFFFSFLSSITTLN